MYKGGVKKALLVVFFLVYYSGVFSFVFVFGFGFIFSFVFVFV